MRFLTLNAHADIQMETLLLTLGAQGAFHDIAHQKCTTGRKIARHSAHNYITIFKETFAFRYLQSTINQRACYIRGIRDRRTRALC